MSAVGWFRAQFMRWLLRAAILLAAFAWPSFAHSQQLPPGILNLDTGWRVHSGDNPAWAQPNFDDSSWPTENLGPNNRRIESGWRWYRKHITLLSSDQPLALLIVAPANAFDIYVNGQRLPGAHILSRAHVYQTRENVLPLPMSSGDLEIAVRIHFPRADTEIYHMTLARAAVGGTEAIDTAASLIHHQRLVALLTTLSLNGSLILGGLGALLLYLLRRDSREYLWLGLYLILGGASTLFYFGALAAALPLPFNSFFGDPLDYFAVIFQIEFTYAFARRLVDRLMRVYEIVLLASVLPGILANLGAIQPFSYILYEEIVYIPAAVLLPILLLVWFLRGNREAGWLIIPSLIPSAGTIFIDLTAGGESPHVGAVPLNPSDVANLIFLLAIGLVMALRFTRVSQEQARSAAELDAAREIQQRLVPITIPQPRGCQIEAAYLPANEVGGDFYQVIEQADGSALIVVGDVSGKGLRAAMTGARAIGSLRAIAASNPSPGPLLDALNRQVNAAHDDGFITCLCASITPAGTLTLANAGHLAPYRNGVEIAVESDLPLGLSADSAYAETTVQLAPGDTLTLLSDGVVEARNKAGELFGFARAAALSTQPAEKIARAAQQIGQDDDITVLTLAFSQLEVTHA
ncbi:MAG: SpoIIE family protein phosphatase [Terracidiphilus sp.]